MRELKAGHRVCPPRRRSSTSARRAPPSGCRCPRPLARACFVDDLELSPLAAAYARARGADRLCSFGDFVALSDVCDEPTARLLAREVSDGIVAPGYEPKALEILKGKKQGKYGVVRIDPAGSRRRTETPRGLRRHARAAAPRPRRDGRGLRERRLRAHATCRPRRARDLTIAWITLKYTQSNSVCFVVDGQAIGVGAGQQSRVHCVRLAGHKADLWRLRQHPHVLGLPFRPGIKRAVRDNAIDQFLRHDVTAAGEGRAGARLFTSRPRQLTAEEKRAWLDGLTGVALRLGRLLPVPRQHRPRRGHRA